MAIWVKKAFMFSWQIWRELLVHLKYPCSVLRTKSLGTTVVDILLEVL